MAVGDPMADIPGQYVAANGLEVYYQEYGVGPPVIVLHGGTGTIFHWTALGAHFRVIAPTPAATAAPPTRPGSSATRCSPTTLLR